MTATGQPARFARLIRKPRLDLAGVLRLTRRDSGRVSEYRLAELSHPDGRCFCLEQLAARHEQAAPAVYVLVSPRGEDYTVPQDGDAGELLAALRALVEAGEL